MSWPRPNKTLFSKTDDGPDLGYSFGNPALDAPVYLEKFRRILL